LTVSVIIPNYNHSAFLKERINSVLNQTCKDFELIILDDCSSDNSSVIIDEYASQYPDIIRYYNDSNSGSPFAQWNFGISKAMGEYIWIAESDDSADPGFLEMTLAVLKKYENAGLVYCDSKAVDEQNGIKYLISEKRSSVSKRNWNEEYINEGKKEIADHFFLGNQIYNASSVLFRKSIYKKAGGTDPSMKFCGDWLLYLKMLQVSDIAYIPLPLNTFRIHSGSSRNFYFRSNKFLKETIKVYKYINSHTDLNVRKKLLIVTRIVKIALLRFYHMFI